MEDKLSETSGQQTIRGFDGLRAIAVLVVFAYHVNIYKFGFGWLGVPFFFVLSGFLITTILLRMKETLPAGQYFQKFYGRRSLRIFPSYYFYLLLVILLFFLRGLQVLAPLRDELESVVWPQLPYAAFYIYDFFYASSKYSLTVFLTHFWSLAVEEQFYIVWPLILLLAPRKKLRMIFLATILLGPILRLATFIIYTRSNLSFLGDDAYLAVYALPFSHIDAFAIGAFASQFNIPHSRKQLGIIAFALLFLGYLTQYLDAGVIDFATLGYEFKMWTAYKFIWGYSLLNYFFALVIYNVRYYQLFLFILERKFLTYIGKISYGIYIYHVAVIHIIVRYMLPDSFTNIWVRFASSLAATLILASLSYYFLERPILNLKDRLFPLRSA